MRSTCSGEDIAGPAFVRTTDGVARPSSGPDILENRAGFRFRELLDPRAQRHRTTAILETAEGPRVVGQQRDLPLEIEGALKEGEIGARAPGEHAEIKVLGRARSLGLTPKEIATSRPICPEQCEPAIEAAGGRVIEPGRTRAVFPQQ